MGWDGMGYLQTGPFLDNLAVIINQNEWKGFDSYSSYFFMRNIGISKCQDMVPNIKMPSKTKVAPPH